MEFWRAHIGQVRAGARELLFVDRESPFCLALGGIEHFYRTIGDQFASLQIAGWVFCTSEKLGTPGVFHIGIHREAVSFHGNEVPWSEISKWRVHFMREMPP